MEATWWSRSTSHFRILSYICKVPSALEDGLFTGPKDPRPPYLPLSLFPSERQATWLLMIYLCTCLKPSAPRG